MARKKNSKPAKKGGRGSRREAAAVAEPVAAVEEVDGGGMGVDEGMIFATFLMLAVAVGLMYFALDSRYGPVF